MTDSEKRAGVVRRAYAREHRERLLRAEIGWQWVAMVSWARYCARAQGWTIIGCVDQPCAVDVVAEMMGEVVR